MCKQEFRENCNDLLCRPICQTKIHVNFGLVSKVHGQEMSVIKKAPDFATSWQNLTRTSTELSKGWINMHDQVKLENVFHVTCSYSCRRGYNRQIWAVIEGWRSGNESRCISHNFAMRWKNLRKTCIMLVQEVVDIQNYYSLRNCSCFEATSNDNSEAIDADKGVSVFTILCSSCLVALSRFTEMFTVVIWHSRIHLQPFCTENTFIFMILLTALYRNVLRFGSKV